MISRKRVWIAPLLLGLALLVWFSARLALTRIYQVDECQNLYMARVLATGQSSEFFTSASLFLLGPLSWLTKSAAQSAQMFTEARLLFLALFWLNILLLALIVAKPALSLRGLIALLAASTLAPLWDYGFEIRHDNVLLTGILLMWYLARVRPLGIVSYLLMGITTIALLFIAVKAVVYVIPLSFATMAFPSPGHNRPRWQLALAWVGGVLLGVALVRACYGTGGAWDQYLSVFRGVSKYSASGGGGHGRSWPWTTLARLLVQTPLLLLLTASAGIAVVVGMVRSGKSAFTWEGMLPEMMLLLGALAALLANPTPYPYNLIHVVPYAFIFAFKYATRLENQLRSHPNLWPSAWAALVCIHLLPFGVATVRHLEYTDSRQRELMRAAEELTDPAKDRVYDAIGMMPTRLSVHHHWYLHGLSMSLFSSPGTRVRDILAAHPPAVVIPSYRTDWLPQEDHEFIRRRYIPLADDFWVLGMMLPKGGSTFDIAHPGRYQIARVKSGTTEAGEFQATTSENAFVLEDCHLVPGKLDGNSISTHPVELSAGTHRIETSADCQPAVVWIGPHLDKLPRLGPGDHRVLFVNWY